MSDLRSRPTPSAQRGAPLYYVVRHGWSEANEADLIVSSEEHGIPRFGLAERGRSQVVDSATSVLRVDPTLRGTLDTALIVASPFLRTQETAQILREILGVREDVRLDRRLRERHFGEFELQSATNYERVWRKDAIDPKHTFFGVESTRGVQSRLLDLLNDFRRSGCSVVFLCTHGDTGSILRATAAGIPLTRHREFSMDPAEIALLPRVASPKSAAGSARR